ncbi:nuclear transport factor 2 family protein [Paraburkholderia sp. USG1]|uniref:nuclear transport factor 2 family protein n=1 Tax=Paraburkholderia sp. USG1 TaxID=2952268 RepID=UPI002858D51A|nr:nuclear transport factor 2 family protein [Paraburkholderia sp. USG1]MDR8402157.1 nuclear transport factor 2 family protein [Paraburkholderia sp. USG1]
MIDRLEKALIRTEIEALNAEFAWLIDHDRSDEVAKLFTPEGSYGRSSGERSVGRAAIRQAYAARSSRGARTARHIFTNLRLGYDSPTRATGTVMLILFAEDGPPPHPAEPNLVSEYEDIYERDIEGVWRYVSRTVTSLFRHPGDKPMVLPLGGATVPEDKA